MLCTVVMGQQYVVGLRHWGVRHGLSHRQVNSIFQDAQGFVWLGTPIGLNRFDGIRFAWYTREKDSLPFNNIGRIAGDANGNLWLASPLDDGGQLVNFNPVTGKSFLYAGLAERIGDLSVDVLYTMRDSSIVIRTKNNAGDFTWHHKKGYSKVVVRPGHYMIGVLPEKNAYVAENDSQEVFLVSMDGRIMKKSVAPFAKGSFAFWNAISGLFVKDVKARRIYSISPDLEIKYAGVDFDVLNNERSADIIDVFSTGIENILWCEGALYEPGKGMLRDFRGEGLEGMNSNIRSLFADRHTPGRLWMTNDYGVYALSINRNKFRQFSNTRNKKTSVLNPFRGLVEDDGYLYGCSESQGVMKIDPRNGAEEQFMPPPPFSDGNLALCKSASGSFIASTPRSNIYERTVAGTTSYYTLPDTQVNECWHMMELWPGRFLCGEHKGLRWLHMPGAVMTPFDEYNRFASLSTSHVLYIAPDSRGRVWICANTGFYQFDTASGIIARYSSADTGRFFLPAREFQHFYDDSAGGLWLATTSGLLHWQTVSGNKRLYTRTDGLSNNNIYAVYGDSYGQLWLSSDYGIIKFDKATGAVNTYLTEDGITHNEFNRISHCKGKNGTLYFGSLDGVTALNPSDFVKEKDEKNASLLAITAFSKFNGKSNKLEDQTAGLLKALKILIFPHDRFFTLEFALLDYSDPEQATYYWRIEGTDTTWNAQKDRTLRFSNLPYGKRKLYIKAQAAEGSWSRNVLVIDVEVIRPFYLRPWFITLVALVLCAAFVGYNRRRVYRFKRENQRLDKVVREKTEDLQNSLAQKEILLSEVHHRVKNNLQIITSLLELQSLQVADENAKAALMESQARVMSMAIIHKKLYQYEKLDSVDLRSFAEDLFLQIKGMSANRTDTVHINNELREEYFPLDTIIPLGLILNELMINSFKYAYVPEGNLSVSLSITNTGSSYILVYSDNGQGLPAGFDIQKSSTLGMHLVRRLSRQIGGKATYVPGAGCTFHILFTNAC